MLQSGLGAVARHSLNRTLNRSSQPPIAALPASLRSPIHASATDAWSLHLCFSPSRLSSSSSPLSSCTELPASTWPTGSPYIQRAQTVHQGSFSLLLPRRLRSSAAVQWSLHQPRSFSSSAFVRLAAEDADDKQSVRRRGRKAKVRDDNDKSELLGLNALLAGTAAPDFLSDRTFDNRYALRGGGPATEADGEDGGEDGGEEAERPNDFDDFDRDDELDAAGSGVISEESELLAATLETHMTEQELGAPADQDDESLDGVLESLLDPDAGTPDWYKRMTPAMQARTDLNSPSSVEKARQMYELRQAARDWDVAKIRQLRLASSSPRFVRLSYDYEIYASALARQPLEAYNVFKSMMEQGLTVTEVTSANLLLAYFRSGLYEDCFAMFEYLQSLGPESRPDELVYNLMIMTCAKVQKPERAMLFFEAMKQAGCKPLPRTFTALIHAASRCPGWYEEAFRLVRQMKDEYGYNINDTRIWTSLLYACAYAGDIQGSKQVLLAISQYGHPITDRYLALMLRCLAITSKNAHPVAIKQNIETADRVWKQVEEVTVSRPHTFALNAYMEVFARTGRVQRAEAVFRSYERYEAQHDAKSHTILIQMYLRLKKFTEAEALHRRLMTSGLEHDNKIYGCMVRGFARANYFRSSLRYLHEMIKAGVRPNPSETRLLALKTYDYPHIRTMIGLLLKEAGITGLDLQPYFRTNKTPTRLFTRQKGGESGAFKQALLNTGVKLGMGPEFTQESAPTIFRFNRPRSMKPVAKRHGKTKSFRKGL